MSNRESDGAEHTAHTTQEDIEEHRIELSQFDLDHLNGGQPIFKAVGDDIRLVLYSNAPLENGDSNE